MVFRLAPGGKGVQIIAITTTIDRGSVGLNQGSWGLLILIINNDDLWLFWFLRYLDNGVIVLLWLFWLLRYLNNRVVILLWLLALFGAPTCFWGCLQFFATSLGPSASALIALAVCQQEPSYGPRLHNL